MSVCLYHYPTTDLVNDFLGSLCTSISVLYTHSDREVIKLLLTQILSCTTHVSPSMQSDTPLLVSTDVYHVQNLASTFPVNLTVSPYPILVQDTHHVRSCHECQICSTRKAEVPLVVSPSPRLFMKIYVDVMLMPKARGYRYLVAARDDLSLATEGRALKHANADSLAKFFWEGIMCRYGFIAQIVTDNGSEVKGTFEKLMKHYSIPHICISPYNSKANGVVEHGHFIIHEAIIKSCNGDINLWPTKVHHAFFADKVITRCSTGFSPFYLLHGLDPVLPFDLFEAMHLVEGFHSGMSSQELLALRIRQLEKRPDDVHAAFNTLYKSRLHSNAQFEKKYIRRLVKSSYEAGDLVLVHNTQVEKELDRKSKPRYLGPFEVVRRTQGGSYVLKEMDGTISARGVAAF